MSQDEYHAALTKRFGVRVPASPDYIEVPEGLEKVVIDFFSRLAALDPDGTIRVQRIWIDGKLRIAVSGRRLGLDDLIVDAEDAAAMTLKAAEFPLMPDSAWHESMVSRYGDAVPPITRLHIRRGLQARVGDLFADLAMADRFNACRIHGIETRSAGFAIIDARFADKATEADRRMCNMVLEPARERLSEMCEHCGRKGEIIAKAGLEAFLEDPNSILGDCLLCMECYESWRNRHDK